MSLENDLIQNEKISEAFINESKANPTFTDGFDWLPKTKGCYMMPVFVIEDHEDVESYE